MIYLYGIVQKLVTFIHSKYTHDGARLSAPDSSISASDAVGSSQ